MSVRAYVERFVTQGQRIPPAELRMRLIAAAVLVGAGMVGIVARLADWPIVWKTAAAITVSAAVALQLSVLTWRRS